MQREQEEQREECAMIIKAPPHGRAQMYPMWHMYIHIKTKKVLKKGSRHTKMEQLHSLSLIVGHSAEPHSLATGSSRCSMLDSHSLSQVVQRGFFPQLSTDWRSQLHATW